MHFDSVTRRHFNKRGRDELAKQARLASFDAARAAISNPHEIWEDPSNGRKAYIRFERDGRGHRVVNAVDEVGGHVYSWHSSAKSFDHYRKGRLLYVRA